MLDRFNLCVVQKGLETSWNTNHMLFNVLFKCVWQEYDQLLLGNIWVFPKIRVPQNGWFIMENPIKMDDLGAHPYFWKHPYSKTNKRHCFHCEIHVWTKGKLRWSAPQTKNCWKQYRAVASQMFGSTKSPNTPHILPRCTFIYFL